MAKNEAADRMKALDSALGQIEKQFGQGSIMKLGEDHFAKIPAIPTGAITLDLALGVGGIPKSRVTEIYGPESSGKSSPARFSQQSFPPVASSRSGSRLFGV